MYYKLCFLDAEMSSKVNGETKNGGALEHPAHGPLHTNDNMTFTSWWYRRICEKTPINVFIEY